MAREALKKTNHNDESAPHVVLGQIWLNLGPVGGLYVKQPNGCRNY